MKKILFIYCIGSVFLFGCLSEACQPCKPPTYKQAFSQADFVLVAYQVKKPSPPNYGDESFNFKDFETSKENQTRIKIVSVLKGVDLKKHSIIGVRARYGMCDYGLFLKDEQKYLIFLRKAKSGFETLSCKPSELLVKENMISVNSKKIKLSEALREWSKP